MSPPDAVVDLRSSSGCSAASTVRQLATTTNVERMDPQSRVVVLLVESTVEEAAETRRGGASRAGGIAEVLKGGIVSLIEALLSAFAVKER